MANVLVTGGAGYIGSVTSLMLAEKGHRVTVLDNLSSGFREAIGPGIRLAIGDISDAGLVSDICADGIDIVMHFAARIEVAESVKDPARYYENNVVNTVRLLRTLLENDVDKLVFSSTAAVYGEPEMTPLTEEAALRPVNPYGHTKLVVEQVLRDYDRAYGFRSVALRYFNAGGAYGPCGESHHPETHLIPRILNALMDNEPFTVFGTDYGTRDGSCVRDYIHVADIAAAHIRAADYLSYGGPSDCFNLGTGKGYSVLEVIKAVEGITGKKADLRMFGRRDGDSAVLVASPRKAQSILGLPKDFRPQEDIIASAWEWKQRFPAGYRK